MDQTIRKEDTVVYKKHPWRVLAVYGEYCDLRKIVGGATEKGVALSDCRKLYQGNN